MVLHHNHHDYQLVPPNKVFYDGKKLNLTKDEGLLRLNRASQAQRNTKNIVEYLVRTSIRCILLANRAVFGR